MREGAGAAAACLTLPPPPVQLPADPNAPGIDQPTFDQTGNLLRLCGCTNDEFDFTPRYDDIRSYSDRFMANGDTRHKKRLSNLVWAWGQFIDHDVRPACAACASSARKKNTTPAAHCHTPRRRWWPPWTWTTTRAARST